MTNAPSELENHVCQTECPCMEEITTP